MDSTLWQQDLERLIAENPVTLRLADGRDIQCGVVSDPMEMSFATGGYDEKRNHTLNASRASFNKIFPIIRDTVTLLEPDEEPQTLHIKSLHILEDRVTVQIELAAR